MVSQIGASASRAITLLTASTDTEPKAGKMWFSREESHESLCRLFAQPPLSALWQARAASANVGTVGCGKAGLAPTSSPLRSRARRSAALVRASASDSREADPSPRSRRLPSTWVRSTHAREPLSRTTRYKPRPSAWRPDFACFTWRAVKPGILQLLRPTFGPTLRIGLCGTIEDCRRRLLGTKRRETKPWRRLDFLWNESFTDLGSTNRYNPSKSGLDLGGQIGREHD